MEAPWSKVLWWWYSWKLERQFPEDAKYLGITYLPTAWKTFGGFSWNYRWYVSLVNKVHLPDPMELTMVSESRPLPASFNYIDSTHLESARRINSGLRVLEENIPKVRAYRELEYLELNCMQLCMSANRLMGQQNADMICDASCMIGRKQAMVDLKGEIRKWRNTALSCMRKHGVAQGDGNNAAFDKCAATYADEVVNHSTNADALNTWLNQYKKVTIDTAPMDISKTMNVPA